MVQKSGSFCSQLRACRRLKFTSLGWRFFNLITKPSNKKCENLGTAHGIYHIFFFLSDYTIHIGNSVFSREKSAAYFTYFYTLTSKLTLRWSGSVHTQVVKTPKNGQRQFLAVWHFSLKYFLHQYIAWFFSNIVPEKNNYYFGQILRSGSKIIELIEIKNEQTVSV